MSGPEEQILLELNSRRETWCQVETNPRQSWERTERRHHPGHLRTSPILVTTLSIGPQHREACTQRTPPIKLPERRHFDESYKSHLVKMLQPHKSPQN
ncbi:hypothetical protein Q5P01_004622 [Channa striata]|uniref:Uncharacterized protein n=1 Tax=Channa striata TaxID=64152 RepID=A0AA88NC62_CHASR|nr:hypothetical protein Q5P01_004622 [Channa striata]